MPDSDAQQSKRWYENRYLRYGFLVLIVLTALGTAGTAFVQVERTVRSGRRTKLLRAGVGWAWNVCWTALAGAILPSAAYAALCGCRYGPDKKWWKFYLNRFLYCLSAVSALIIAIAEYFIRRNALHIAQNTTASQRLSKMYNGEEVPETLEEGQSPSDIGVGEIVLFVLAPIHAALCLTAFWCMGDSRARTGSEGRREENRPPWVDPREWAVQPLNQHM